MFYSQFILAKKGPLGTIWIAAHLERKLRKNQVADTDIGVSVDSILSPDVPIALRLSSHLLLGVVRIYNRKVNYLFDDCSETLLKIKQAFRSTAVDLPPEESKAPYHSITLPEKFDLDDFELPDSDIFQGNYVDHHISSREQITLQDTMEGVDYSTSKFGLDERFGDADTSGLDLDEELFLAKIGTEGRAVERTDPQTSFGSTSTHKQDQQPEDRAANSEDMVAGVGEFADVVDYAQAPRTPGLVEEPNLSNVQDPSGCDDHLESEYHLMESSIRENTNNVPYEDKQDVSWCSRDDAVSDAIPQGPSEENGYLSGNLEVKEPMPQGQIEPIRPVSDFTNEVVIKAPDISLQVDAPTEAVNEEKIHFLSVDETFCDNQGPNEIGLQKSASGISGLAGSDQQVFEDVSAKGIAPTGGVVPGNVGDSSIQQKSCRSRSEVASENQVGFVETPETKVFQGATGSSSLNFDAHYKETASETLLLRPCISIHENPNMTEPGFSRSADGGLKSDNNSLAGDGTAAIAIPGEMYSVNGDSEQNLTNKQVQEHASGEDVQVPISEADGLVHTTYSRGRLVQNLNSPAELMLPAPEKLLSVPEGHIDLHKGLMIEASPEDVGGLDEGDAGSKTAAGRKRSFTESTLTEQSLNSIESSRQVRAKQTAGLVPNDDDLLSSILVGRKSSILRVKPTPPLYEVTSMKRIRSAPRSGAPKRKVHMDDTMVLHGDTIRQQLTCTEGIRRIRKKAPCTLPEISMIQKQHMEDEIFLQPVLNGMSVDLVSLHGQVYDLSRIRVRQNEVNDASLEISIEPRLLSQDDENNVSPENLIELNLASHREMFGPSLENVPRLCLTSPNNRNHGMEDDSRLGKTDATGVSGEGLNNEFLAMRHNETSKLIVNPLPSEKKPDEVDYTNVASPPVIASDTTGHATDDVGDASDKIVQTASLNESGETTAYEKTDATIVPDHKEVAHSVELDYVDLDYGEAIARNGVREKDDYVREEGETEHGEKDDMLLDMTQDAAHIKLVPNTNHVELEYHTQGEICSTTFKEQQEVDFSCPELENMLQDGSINKFENPDIPKAYETNVMDAEISGLDLRDQDGLSYSAAGNDTDFLNVDDDDLTEMADDYVPDAEESRYAENNGWSSRTRAVSKYLQCAFAKEAVCGSKSLSLNNLLTGKSRKEASRMFFETLVLKTRDYIHVEQQNPFDDITIKPRMMLMKSDF